MYHRRRKQGVEGAGRPPRLFGLTESFESRSRVLKYLFLHGSLLSPLNPNHLPTPVCIVIGVYNGVGGGTCSLCY